VYGDDRVDPLCVRAAPPRVPDFAAVHAALDGARAELSRAGALGPEGRFPCVVLELLRVEESSSGVLALGDVPRARGSSFAVTGRAWVQTSRGAPFSRDTGDVRRSVRLEAGATVGADAARQRRALSAAADALGRALVQRVLGLPVPSDGSR